MFKTRVRFRVKGQTEIQLGNLVKDKHYKNGYKIVSMDKKSCYCVSLLDLLVVISSKGEIKKIIYNGNKFGDIKQIS
jgi:tricorn protease-like protein